MASGRRPWDGVVPESEIETYRLAGLGAPSGFGVRPALLVIDVQYRSVGDTPRPIREAIKQLTHTGYLEVRRGRFGGYFVLASWSPASAAHVRRHLVANWAEFEQIFDTRNLIEPLIASTAALRRTTRDIQAMDTALQAYLDAPDHDASRRADASLQDRKSVV